MMHVVISMHNHHTLNALPMKTGWKARASVARLMAAFSVSAGTGASVKNSSASSSST